MIQIDDKIVSTDLLTEKFCCDPSRCKGACCVEGNAGALLEAEEIEILEREYETYKPYLKPEGSPPSNDRDSWSSTATATTPPR